MINLGPLKNRPPYVYALSALAFAVLGFLGCRAVRWYRGQDHKAKPVDDTAKKVLSSSDSANPPSNSSTLPSIPQLNAGTMASTTTTILPTTLALSSPGTTEKTASIFSQTLTTTTTSTVGTTSTMTTTTTDADVAAEAGVTPAPPAQSSTSELVVQPKASQSPAITLTLPNPPQEAKGTTPQHSNSTRPAFPTPVSDYRALMASPQSPAQPSTAKSFLSPTQTRARDFKSIRTGTPAYIAAPAARTPGDELAPRRIVFDVHTPLIEEEESEALSP